MTQKMAPLYYTGQIVKAVICQNYSIAQGYVGKIGRFVC